MEFAPGIENAIKEHGWVGIPNSRQKKVRPHRRIYLFDKPGHDKARSKVYLRASGMNFIG